METIEARRPTHTPSQSEPLIEAVAPRHDCYAGIHKALRLCLARTLTQVGSADPEVEREVLDAAGAVAVLLDASESHLAKEDLFMHPLLDRAQPGSSSAADQQHEHHRASIAHLKDLAQRLAEAPPAARPAALSRLYLALAAFMAEDLAHMNHEETEHNALLWAHYSDDELRATEQRIVAAIPPDQVMQLLRWFMPALNAPERLHMLAGMRAGAPAPVFEAALSVARDVLLQADYAKLARQLGLAPVPGLVSAERG